MDRDAVVRTGLGALAGAAVTGVVALLARSAPGSGNGGSPPGGRLVETQRDMIRRLRATNAALARETEDRRQAEERLRAVLEHSVDAAYRRNIATDEYEYLSPATLTVLGVAPDRLAAMSMQDVLDRIHPDDVDRVTGAIEAGLGTGAGQIEYRFRGDDQRYRWVADHFTVQHDDHGRPVYRTGVVRDVTARKRAEEERDRERLQLDATLEALPVGVLIADREGRIVRDNAASREIWGVPPETGSWEAYGDWVGWWPDTGERIEAGEWAMARALVRGEETRNELVRNQKFGSGERGYFLNNVSPLRDENGTIIGGVAAMLDVTDRLAAEEAREEATRRAENAENHLRTVFEEAPVVLATTEGPDHVVRIQNEAHRRLFGGRSAIGQPLGEAFPELRDQGFIERLDEVYRTGDSFLGREVPGEIDVTGAGSVQRRFFNFAVQPMADPDGAVNGLMSVAVDVTDTVRARHAAEIASQAKSQFLAIMSHEIRTPLNAVLGYTDILHEGVVGELTPEQRRYLGRISASGAHLLTLINDVLDLAKIEAGELHVSMERVLTHMIMHDALSVAEPLLEKKGLSIEGKQGLHTGLQVWGDESRVRQILVNLLSNAGKFTEEGAIRVRTVIRAEQPEPVDAAHDGAWIGLEVCDTGIGIPAADLDRIFEPFVQREENIYTRRHEGTGLGLAISRQLARMMGGDITVESREGEGSVFTLWLPAARDSDTGPPDRRRGGDRRTDDDRRLMERRAPS